MPSPLNRRHLFWLLPVIVVAAGGLGVSAMMQPPPVDLDLSLSHASEHGAYIATLVPGRSPIVVGVIDSWTLQVTTADGQPVDGARILVGGGMPQHGHGLPTSPRVSAELGGGRYQIDGMKFNMPGWWTLTLSVDGPSGPDTATFNLIL